MEARCRQQLKGLEFGRGGAASGPDYGLGAGVICQRASAQPASLISVTVSCQLAGRQLRPWAGFTRACTLRTAHACWPVVRSHAVLCDHEPSYPCPDPQR